MAAIYDVSTGRATVGDVFTDIGIFVEGWIVSLIAPTYDAELENTHAYALFLLLIPGLLLLLFFNLVPFFNRGKEFQVHPDGSVSVRRGDSWEPLMEYQYSVVTADGTTIEFTPPPDGPPKIVLPQDRVFSREYDARLPDKVSASSSGGCWQPGDSTSSRRHRAATASQLAASNVRRSGRLNWCSWSPSTTSARPLS